MAGIHLYYVASAFCSSVSRNFDCEIKHDETEQDTRHVLDAMVLQPPHEDLKARSAIVSRDEYGYAYQLSFQGTVRFLGSKGLSHEFATEVAQIAWAKGWECLTQLRDRSYLLTWVNSIALNACRRALRYQRKFQPLMKLSVSPRIELAAVDVTRILDGCKPAERQILRQHHLEERPIPEIAKDFGCSETAMRLRLLRARQSARVRITAGSNWKCTAA